MICTSTWLRAAGLRIARSASTAARRATHASASHDAARALDDARYDLRLVRLIYQWCPGRRRGKLIVFGTKATESIYA